MTRFDFFKRIPLLGLLFVSSKRGEACDLVGNLQEN